MGIVPRFPCPVMPVTYTLTLSGLPYPAPGVRGSVLGLVGPVSVYREWAESEFDLQLLSVRARTNV